MRRRIHTRGAYLSLIITAVAFVSALLVAAAISSGHWWSAGAIVAAELVGALFSAWWCVLRAEQKQRRAAVAMVKADADAAALADCKRAARQWLDQVER